MTDVFDVNREEMPQPVNRNRTVMQLRSIMSTPKKASSIQFVDRPLSLDKPKPIS